MGKKIITSEEFDTIIDKIYETLLDKNLIGGAWFDTEEECEDWMGDIFYEALEIALNQLGYEIEWE